MSGDPPIAPGLDGEGEDLRAVREALDELRHEIRTRFARDDESPSGPGRRSDWEEAFGSLRRRLANLGVRERSDEIDEFGMDVEAVEAWRPVFDFLFDRYWRVHVDGSEHLPKPGPCLLVANRSGILPYDGWMIAHAVERAAPALGRPRFSVADWLITRPFAQPQLTRLGGVRACRENVERLLATGSSVSVFPEGAKGATKEFRDRYRLQRFGRGGVIRVALASGVPLIPVGVVGAEEAHPVLWKARTPGRWLGLPFVPVTPTFPLLGPLGALPLPTQWVLRFGEPFDFGDLPPDAERDELLISRLNEDLRARIQALVDGARSARESIWTLAD